METRPNEESAMETNVETNMEKKQKSGRGGGFKNAFRTRAFRAGGYSTLAALIVVAIAIAAMLIVNAIPSKYTELDATSNDLYTLSDQSVQILANLQDDVTIYVIAQTGDEDDTLGSLLDQYKGGSSHIQVETIDPVVSPNFVSQYTSDSVYENSLLLVCGERSRYVSYYDIYETDYSSYYTTGETTTTFNGESEITSAIDYVTSEDLPVAYQLQGHGEQGLGSDEEDAIAGENIELEDLNLLTEESVPDDCSCLIIASPQTDISSDEEATILSYLQNGGRMLLVTDYTETEMPNLAALMSEYGVSRVDGIVVDSDGSYSVRGYNHYLLPSITSHDITSPLKDGSYYVLMPVAQGLVVADDLRDGLSVTKLLKTSSDSYSKIAGYNMTSYDKEDGDIDGPFALGVAISDTSGSKEARIVWYTTSMMFDSDVDEMVSGANTDLLLNSLDWMCERENTISIHAKSLSGEQLTVPTAAANHWSLILVAALPLALIAAGIVVVVRRKRR